MGRTKAYALAIAGLATIAAVGAGSAAATTPGASKTLPKESCAATNGHLPGWIEGAPTLTTPGRAGATYIWHNARGWHLRVRHHGTSKLTFTGTISTGNGEKISFQPYHLESGDVLAINGTATQLSFTFHNYGRWDGVDFTASCAKSLTFALDVAGASQNPDTIRLGRAKLVAVSNPLTVQRRK